jgi:hypothetical protein
MITTNQPIAALNALRCCSSRLHESRLDALTAATALSGVRANRTHELADKLADALAHCERLAFIVEGDLWANAPGRSTVSDRRRASLMGVDSAP